MFELFCSSFGVVVLLGGALVREKKEMGNEGLSRGA